MKQVMHIFAKDSRHFWPEIGVSLAVIALYTWSTPHGWSQQSALGAAAGFYVTPAFSFLGSSLALFVVVSWWILIARVVHDESLVGERQFWLTRPYQWSQLLVAKILFLLIYLYVPFLAAKLALLHLAGFAAWSYMPGLLYNLLLVTMSLVVTLLAVATVTANFARLALAVVSAMVCFLAVLAVTLVRGSEFTIKYSFLLPLIPCVCVVVIVLQYARRRLWLARALLIAYPLVILITSFLPQSRAALPGNFPPLNGNQSAPLQLTLAPRSGSEVAIHSLPNEKGMQVQVPIEYAGVAPGHMLQSNYIKASIEDAGHPGWISDWQDTPLLRFVPELQNSTLYFKIPGRVLESFRGKRVTLHLSLALTEFRAGPSQQLALQTKDFRVPGLGICAPQAGWDGTRQITGVICKSALRPPPLTYVDTVWPEQACGSAPSHLTNGARGDAWIGEWDQAPAAFGISPIWETSIPFSNSMREALEPGGRQTMHHLCPDSPLIFTPYRPVRRLQTVFTIPNFDFPP